MTHALTTEALALAIESRAIYRIEAYRETGVLYVSNSLLAAFVGCETRGLLTAMGYAGGEESIKMRLGSVAHAAVAVYRKGEGVDAALRLFDAQWKEWSEAAIDQLGDEGFRENMRRIYGWENARRVLSVYFRDHAPLYPFRFHPELVEVAFAIPLTTTGDIIACGKLDALVDDPASDGAWYVDDLKTTGQLDARFAKKFVNDSQFSHYLWGAATHLGHAVVGGVVSALEWSRMPVVKTTAKGVAQKCRTHGVLVDECGDQHVQCKTIGPLLRSATTIEMWKQDALAIATRVRALYGACPNGVVDLPKVANMHGTFNYGCPGCPAQPWCSGDRVVEYVESVLAWQEWEGLNAG